MKLNGISIALLVALILVVVCGVYMVIRSESKASDYRKHAIVGIIQSKVAAQQEIKKRERTIDSLITVQEAAEKAIQKYLQEVEKSYKVDSKIKERYEKEIDAIRGYDADELLRYIADRQREDSHRKP